MPQCRVSSNRCKRKVPDNERPGPEDQRSLGSSVVRIEGFDVVSQLPMFADLSMISLPVRGERARGCRASRALIIDTTLSAGT